MKDITSTSESETARLGFAIGKSLEPCTVIGLTGTLGSGKTRLTQGIARGLDIENGEVTSPTYTLCVPYEGRLGLIHLDAYRIEDAVEIDELGLDELVEDGAVLIVEWARKIEAYLPMIDLWIALEPMGESTRGIQFETKSELGVRLLESTLHTLEETRQNPHQPDSNG